MRSLGALARPVRYPRAAASGSATTPHLAHDVPGHPERPARIRALEAEMARHDWFGWERAEAPRATREQLERGPPGRARRRDRGAVRRRRRADRHGHVVRARAPARRRCAAAGGAVALVDALLGAASRRGFSALRPPGHHAEAAQAMGFCFFDNVAVAAAHARAAHGVERVLILDWDVHHGNGTNAIFHADPSRALRLDPRVAAVSGHGAGLGPRLGRGRGLHGQPARPAGSGDAVLARWSSTSCAPLVARLRARARARLGGLRRAPRPTRSRRCRSPRRATRR